jgi:hypothetical protein
VSIDPVVVVALVTAGGTLGATAVTQFAAIRNKRLDADIERRARFEERGEAASADKLATYVQLNAAARAYRAVGHDYLKNRLDNVEHGNLEQFEKVRTKYREAYAGAQMILPDRVFKLAREVNDCLGHGYRAIHDLGKGSGDSITGEMLHKWYDGPLANALHLLRCVLREDLGVADTNTDVDREVRRLQQARHKLWPDEISELPNSPEDAL